MSSGESVRTLDRAVALIHVDGDVQLLSELAALFLQDYPRLIGQIRTSIRERDCEVLERAAHTLKGRLAFFGITKFQQQCFELERMGREKDPGGALQLLVEIEPALEAMLPEFETLVHEQSG
ncbi:MAG: Hpt domain-containing protein [Acidobacteria bacterium]|nr:Hpt domain-containing protein [Acidobacteriota bacterium]